MTSETLGETKTEEIPEEEEQLLVVDQITPDESLSPTVTTTEENVVEENIEEVTPDAPEEEPEEIPEEERPEPPKDSNIVNTENEAQPENVSVSENPQNPENEEVDPKIDQGLEDEN